MRLAGFLVRFIENRGWSLSDLADATIIPQTTLWNLIHGKQQPTLRTLDRLAVGLGVSIVTLLEYTDCQAVLEGGMRERLEDIVEARPYLAPLMEKLADSDSATISDTLNYIRFVRQSRTSEHGGNENGRAET